MTQAAGGELYEILVS